jgi:sRNA-binding regulator protein Hfq
MQLETLFYGGTNPMNSQVILPGGVEGGRRGVPAYPAQRKLRNSPSSVSFRFSQYDAEDNSAQRQAELFYLQKQIQSQTPMVIVLEDGERVEGCIEWYDRSALKVRGRTKTLIYKSAIRYMYKLGEAGL